MSDKASKAPKKHDARSIMMVILRYITRNWKLKLLSLLVGLTIWGALISEDANLTREKSFNDVSVQITGTDTLQRNGLVVVSGLEDLQPIKIRAQVPQRMYEAASSAHYAVRVDVSRLTSTGNQVLPILHSANATYGAVSYLSQDEVQVVVDEYVTRRRIPVRLSTVGSLSEGMYGAAPSVDPFTVVVSGPRSQVDRISYLSAVYDLGLLDQLAGSHFSAVPFRLMSIDGQEIPSKQINVTSENVRLDTLLVEQDLYPSKLVPINLSGVVKGQVASGFQITRVSADPAQVRVAGELEYIQTMDLLDLASDIDVSGLRETIIRAIRVNRPADAVHLSDNAVYVTVEIEPMIPDGQNTP